MSTSTLRSCSERLSMLYARPLRASTSSPDSDVRVSSTNDMSKNSIDSEFLCCYPDHSNLRAYKCRYGSYSTNQSLVRISSFPEPVMANSSGSLQLATTSTEEEIDNVIVITTITGPEKSVSMSCELLPVT